MKKIFLITCLVLAVFSLKAQEEITVKFTSTTQIGAYCPFNAVNVSNLSRGWDEVLYYPDTTLSLACSVGLSEMIEISPITVYPNPFSNSTNASFSLETDAIVKIQLFQLNGKEIASFVEYYEAGEIQIRVAMSEPQMALLVITTANSRQVAKILNVGNGNCNSIEATHYASKKGPDGSKANLIGDFMPGDTMRYEAVAYDNGNMLTSEIFTKAQYEDETIALEFVVTIPDVNTFEVSNITQTSALGGGEVTMTGGLPVTERGICWGTAHNPTISQNHNSNGSGIGAYSVNMYGLVQNTTYYVRAYAINGVGISYGQEVHFTTSDNISAPSVTTSQVANISQNTAVGGGNVTADGGASVTERGICWSTGHNPTINNSHGSNGSGLGNYTVNMTGLSAGTAYYVRAYAINSQGISYGQEVSFTTTAEPPTVTTSQVTNITQTTATGGGNVTFDGGATVTERGICWSTSHNPTTSSSHGSSGTGTGSYSVSMTGLTANTTYYVRAYATNSVGTDYGSEVSFTTSQVATYNIIVSANPSTGGSVSGGGNYQQGQNCTVTATAASGYSFYRWTENGTPVSTNASYTFSVNSDRTLVANFAENGGSHTYVDLGLPSGLLWAVCNVGAVVPEDYGNYYAWGETQPKNTYDWGTYFYCNGSNNTLTKYCTDPSLGYNGFVDNLTTLLHEDDAATVNWGTDWRTPTDEEWQELYQNTSHIYTTQNGVHGRLFTASNGSSLFLPAAGYREGNGLFDAGCFGDYWSSSLETEYPYYAFKLFFSGEYCEIQYFGDRNWGFTVRAVRSPSQNVSPPTVTTNQVTNITQTTATGGGNVTVDGGGMVTERGICWSTSHNPTTSGNHANSGTGTGNFTVSMTGLTANTTYYVRAYATNSAGTAYGSEVSFTTLQNATLPTVTTSQVTNITQTSATGGGNVTNDGGGTVTERGICWSTSHNPTTSGSHGSSGTGTGSYTVSMTGLTANTTYYVRAYATNSAGTAYGSEVSFTTSQNVTLPTVTTSQVTNITQTTATGGGNVTSDGGATVTERGICWSTSHNPTTSGSHGSSGTGTGSYTVSMTGLTANTTYYVRAYATNSAGTAYGNEVSFTTSQNVTLPTVTTSQVTNITQTTATGGGNVTSDGGATVTERGICWSTSHNPTTSSSHGSSGTGTGSYSVSMTGLTANTTYYVRAYATNSAGTAYGSEVSFTTSQNVTLPTVTTSQVTNITQNTALGGGVVISDGGAAVSERGVCWSTSHNPTMNNTHGHSGTGTGSFTIVISNLTPSTTYYIRAYAVNTIGVAYGSEINFTTLSNGDIPIGAINGLFTVNGSGGQVYFSQGNLQYIGSSGLWKFADEQWDIIGASQCVAGQNITRDLFGWGTSGYNHGASAYYPWSVNYQPHLYWAYGNWQYSLYNQTGKADWGYNAISNGGNQENYGWRTLTRYEWNYIINERNTVSGARYAKANVCGVDGLLLLPDDWNISIYNLNSINSSSASFSSNTIDIITWAEFFAPNGVVFLPNAGTRRHETSTGLVTWYITGGGYWSSLYHDEDYAWSFGTNSCNYSSTIRANGLSVRLVKNNNF